jgi:Protein of unknown function (DUF3592)
MKFSIANFRTKLLICFAVWLVFAGLGLAIGLTLTDWLHYRNLSSGVGTRGQVIAKEPDNHRIVRYSFRVGQQSFEGVGHGGRGNPSFQQLHVGDQVVVFYDAANPNRSVMGNPSSHQNVELGGIVFLVLFLPLFPLGLAIILIVVLSKPRPSGEQLEIADL